VTRKPYTAGQECIVELPTKYHSATVTSASPLLIKKYPTYAPLNQRNINIIEPYDGGASSYMVFLSDEGEDFWFILSDKYIKNSTARLPCNCELRLLMCSGCQCGAFKKEQNAGSTLLGVPYGSQRLG